MNGFSVGAILAWRRLASLRTLVAVGLVFVVVVLVAWIERRSEPFAAADRALAGVAFGLALPLGAWGLVASALGGRSARDAARELARHGVDRRRALAGALVLSAGVLAASGAVLAASAVVAARGVSDPAVGRDAWVSGYVGALSGIAYAALFVVASLAGGAGRFVVFLADWIVGSGTNAAAIPLPRGHVRNLLGLEPVVSMPAWSASLALGGLALVYAAIALGRTPR